MRWMTRNTMKRTIHAVVTIEAFVDLEIDDEEQPCADPAWEISDGEAAETAITTMIGQYCDVYVFGEEVNPAKVFIDNIDVNIDGEC